MAEVSSSSSSNRRNRFKVKRVEAAVGQSDAEGDDNYESDKEVKFFFHFQFALFHFCKFLVDDVYRKKATTDPSRLKWANGRPTKAIELLHPRPC